MGLKVLGMTAARGGDGEKAAYRDLQHKWICRPDIHKCCKSRSPQNSFTIENRASVRGRRVRRVAADAIVTLVALHVATCDRLTVGAMHLDERGLIRGQL